MNSSGLITRRGSVVPRCASSRRGSATLLSNEGSPRKIPPLVHTDRPCAKPKVFLSYGRRDATALARRLRDDLSAAGYAMWMDTDAIIAGQPWTDQIERGLSDAQVMLALLSPSAVRREAASGDSVCLDEIAYAIDARRIPVVPVMALSCEPPFRIFRLHYLDFRACHGEPDGGYSELLRQLQRALDDAGLGKPVPLRSLPLVSAALDFSAFLGTARRDFTGREWLFDELAQWLEAPGSSLLVAGWPGVGKSAWISELLHRNPRGVVLGFHCCMADTPITCDPSSFVNSLIAQLVLRLEGFDEALARSPLQTQVGRPLEDPASVFEACVLEPLTRLAPPRDGPRLLLVDALDEALTHAARPNIVDILGTRLQRFPPWLRLLATTRPERPVLQRLGALARRVIDAEDARNREDLDRYLERQLNGAAQARTALGQAAAGNFLFAVMALDALRNGWADLADITRLPPGLSSLYALSFDRLHAASSPDDTRALFELLVVAEEPPARIDIAAMLGLDESSSIALLARVAAFVAVRDGRYSLFHKSLADWLMGWDAAADQPVAGIYHANAAAGHRRWCAHWLPEARRPVPPPGLLRALPTHMIGAEKWNELAVLLLDGRFVEAKVAAPDAGPNGLLRDLTAALDAMPALHPSRTLLEDLRGVVGRQGQHLRRRELSPVSQLLLQARIDGLDELHRRLAETAPAPMLALRWTTWRPDPALRRVWTVGQGFVHSPSISTDGRWAACGDETGRIFLLDLEAGEIVHSLSGHASENAADPERPVHRSVDCSLAGDASRILSHCYNDNSVRLWDTATGAMLAAWRLPKQLEAWQIATSADLSLLVTCNQADGSPCVSLWRAGDGSRLREFDAPRIARADSAALALEADRLLTCHRDGRLVLWEMQTGRRVSTIHTRRRGSIYHCDLAVDARSALIGGQGWVMVWDIAQSTLRLAPAAPWGTHDAMGLSADAARVLSSVGEGVLLSWDPHGTRPPQRLYGNTFNELWSIAVSRDGRRALSASKGGNMVEWDLDRSDPGHSPRGHGQWIWRCAGVRCLPFRDALG